MPNEHLARVINVNFSTNNIEKQKRKKITRNNKWTAKANDLIFCQILSIYYLTKFIEISLENLYVDIET